MTPHMHAESPGIGISLKVISTLSFTLMSALVKDLTIRYPIGETIFFRSFFALVPLIVWLAWRGEFPSAMRTKNLNGHLKRSLIGSTGMFFGFMALSLLPLTEAVAIGYAAPLITVVLAACFLKETVRLYRWSAVIVGLSGVLIMLMPHLSLITGQHLMIGQDLIKEAETSSSLTITSPIALGAMAAICGAICSAGAAMQTRFLTKTEKTGAIVFYFMVMTSLLSGLSCLFSWNTPNALDFLLLVITGILGGIGQILMTQSFRYADASLIAPFEYTSMIWAVVLGWFVFGQLPTIWVVIGAIIVTFSGLFVIWRERVLGLARAEAARAAPMRNT